MDLKEEDKPNVLPPDLGAVLTRSTYRNYHDADGSLIEDRRGDYELFKWFVKNILYGVNFELTNMLFSQTLDLGHNDFISRSFTVSDEAFAILMVLNYEKRWQNQILHPTKDCKELASNPLYACRWTSSKDGYSKISWKSDGIATYNDLMENIEKLRGVPMTGLLLETKVKRDFEDGKMNKSGKKVNTVNM